MEQPNKLKVIGLRAENIKKLVAVEIHPKGDIIKITGRNEQGKSTILQSIWWALGGTDNIDDMPIRQGEKKARIEIDLGDLIIKRTFTEKGTALVIENKEGMQYKSPQAMLDALIGRLSFDPIAFMRMDPKKQFDTLKELTGVDLSDLDQKRQQLYDERTAKNRDIKALEARKDALVVAPDAPTMEVPATDLIAKIDEANKAIRARDGVVNRLNSLRAANGQSAGRIDQINKQIEALEVEAAGLKTAISANEEEIRKLTPQAEIEVPDVSALQTEMAGLDAKNKAARAYQEKERLRQQLDIANHESQVLSDAINAIDGEKAARVQAANFPLNGLGFGDGMVMYKGLPLSQASQAEKIRVSMAMAMALNPKLRVITVSDASLLDSSNMKIIEDMARENDFQLWLEMMDESGKVGIVIENGSVSKVNEEEQAKLDV